MGIFTATPIIDTHVGGRVDAVDLAFARLAAYFDDDAERLLQLSRLLQLPEVPRLLAALDNLHRDPKEPDHAVLADAEALLRELLDHVQAIPCSSVPTGPIKPGDEGLRREIDAAVRWSGARLEEQHRAVMHLFA